ncbi:hypothetical protein HX030_04060 [Myroides odoratimimus]|uniref:hypothetical protein n=1 Tax=Myroides odoratimimus TaxID=76832 RepID=UPI00103DBC99|nr:hypothetical protein [Myroides odoratimimus]MCA4791958.1 hypothetical protein [Myroides odoratimimus]MCA4805838.1 hypothetical protein [Myroides odoratimimus]MCA4819379.1 hypothetical protein [Myroides odoratimimus]MDM1058392.1 hypothetical protein [Myroides odoratimimus]MDM1327021.1 hypothetical protein [Myroides odoratimimus]
MAKKENYFRYWWKSSNEHGVHSPFIFNLLTKGLYPKDSRWRGMAKKDAFILRMLNYYQPQSLAVHGTLSVEVTCVKLLKESSDAVDMIYMSSVNDIAITDVCTRMHNDSVLVIDRREGREEIEVFWEQIVLDERFSATIDFYYYGVAFIRSEQLKQHFILRM